MKKCKIFLHIETINKNCYKMFKHCMIFLNLILINLFKNLPMFYLNFILIIISI